MPNHSCKSIYCFIDRPHDCCGPQRGGCPECVKLPDVEDVLLAYRQRLRVDCAVSVAAKTIATSGRGIMSEQCISACREKDRLGIKQGWCWTCVQELRQQFREEFDAQDAENTALRQERDMFRRYYESAHADWEAQAQTITRLREALESMVDDLEARWDMRDPRTNPGIRNNVDKARAALSPGGETPERPVR